MYDVTCVYDNKLQPASFVARVLVCAGLPCMLE